MLHYNGGGGNNDNVAIATFNVKNGKLIRSTSTISNGSSPASGVVVNGTVYTGCYTLCAFTLGTRVVASFSQTHERQGYACSLGKPA